MPKNQKSKFIPILLVLVIIAVAGWVVGIKTFSEKKQDDIYRVSGRSSKYTIGAFIYFLY